MSVDYYHNYALKVLSDYSSGLTIDKDTSDAPSILSTYFRREYIDWACITDDMLVTLLEVTHFYQYFDDSVAKYFLRNLANNNYLSSLTFMTRVIPDFIRTDKLYVDMLFADKPAVIQILRNIGCKISICNIPESQVYKIQISMVEKILNNIIDSCHESKDCIDRCFIDNGPYLLHEQEVAIKLIYSELNPSPDLMQPMNHWAAEIYMNSIVERTLSLPRSPTKHMRDPGLKSIYISNFNKKLLFGQFQVSTFARIIKNYIFNVYILPVPLESRINCLSASNDAQYIDRESLTRIFHLLI